MRPPTTIAKGRCESEPMPCEVAAGKQSQGRDEHITAIKEGEEPLLR